MKNKIEYLLEEAFGEKYEPDSRLEKKTLEQIERKKGCGKSSKKNLMKQKCNYWRWQPIVAAVLVICLIGGTSYSVAEKKGKFFKELFVSGMGKQSYSNIVEEKTTKILSLTEESTIEGLKITPVQVVCDGFLTSVMLKVESKGDIIINENSRFSDDVMECVEDSGEEDETAVGGGQVVRYEESEDALYYTLLAKGSDFKTGERVEFLIYVEDLIGLYTNEKGKILSTENKGIYKARLVFNVPEVSRLYLQSDTLGEEGYIKVYPMGLSIVTDLNGGNSKFMQDLLDYKDYNYALLKDGKKVKMEIMGVYHGDGDVAKGDAVATFEEPIDPSQVEEINLWKNCIKY